MGPYQQVCWVFPGSAAGCWLLASCPGNCQVGALQIRLTSVLSRGFLPPNRTTPVPTCKPPTRGSLLSPTNPSPGMSAFFRARSVSSSALPPIFQTISRSLEFHGATPSQEQKARSRPRKLPFRELLPANSGFQPNRKDAKRLILRIPGNRSPSRNRDAACPVGDSLPPRGTGVSHSCGGSSSPNVFPGR